MSLTHGRVIRVDDDTTPLVRTLVRAPTGRIVPTEVVEAAERARQLIDNAESKILDQKAEFERSLESTRAELLREVRAEVELSLAAKFVALNVMRQRSLDQSRDEVAQLARLLAERVLREELTSTPDQFVRLAQKCIAEARGSTRVVIHAHPDDATLLQPQLESLAELVSAELSLEPNTEMLRGDLHLESDVGTLDARLGTQLANLAETIRESLRV